MDTNLFEDINRFAARTGWAHAPLRLFAEYGIVVFALLLLVVYVEGRHERDARRVAGSVWGGAAALVALGAGQLIGDAVSRARPYAVIPAAHVLVSRTADVSFPSDHATVAGAVAVALLVVDRRWGAIGAAFAVLMAVDRVYVGAHYPSDVVGGLALGGVVALAGAWLVLPVITRLVAHLGRTPIGLVVSAGDR